MGIQPLSDKEDYLREERTGFQKYTSPFYLFSMNDEEIELLLT